MKTKIRKKYRYLTFLLILYYFLLIIMNYLFFKNDKFSSFLEIMYILCIVFSVLAFSVTIFKNDNYDFKHKSTYIFALVCAFISGSPIGGVGKSFNLGPKMRYIAPIFIIGGFTAISSLEFLDEGINFALFFIFNIVVEILAIYTAVVCHQYNNL